MNATSWTTSFAVDRDPEQVTKAIGDVRSWWTGDIDGSAAEVGDEFAYQYGDLHHSRQRVTELVPGQRVVWRVLDATLGFAADPHEWTGTDLVFEVTADGEGSLVRFTHQGLLPTFDCYEACSNGWAFFVRTSLRRLLETGEGPSRPPWA